MQDKDVAGLYTSAGRPELHHDIAVSLIASFTRARGEIVKGKGLGVGNLNKTGRLKRILHKNSCQMEFLGY